jgi:transcriptional regulator with XRE-family HTH domain
MRISEIIRVRRQELGLTLEEVGQRVGVGKSTVRKWETGLIENMRRDKISKLAEVLDLPTSVLIGIEENKNSPPPISEDELSANKQALLKLVHDCPEEKAARLLQVLRLFLDSEKQDN